MCRKQILCNELECVNRVGFTVYGEPAGKQRPKFASRGKFIQAYTPKKTENYENLVKMEYQAQVGNVMFPRDRALGITITAYKAIPKSASKRREGLMITDKILPGKKPDWDNVGKIICDALNGIAFADDSQIVVGSVRKLYAPRPRVEVEIWEVGDNG